MQAKFPGRALEKAVKGMLPKGPLGYAMIKKLKVYGGAEHPHTAQNPEIVDVAAMNRKNSTLTANESADKKAAN
jgi:large subunit ribosomal protein L13